MCISSIHTNVINLLFEPRNMMPINIFTAIRYVGVNMYCGKCGNFVEDQQFCSRCGNRLDGEYPQTQQQAAYGSRESEKLKLNINNRYSIIGLLVGFAVTILLGLILGLVAVAIVGLIIYFTSNKSTNDTGNFCAFGVIASLIAYVILILFFSAFLLSL
jgi:hypothetical protein